MKNHLRIILVVCSFLFVGNVVMAQDKNEELNKYVTAYKAETKPEACYNYVGESLKLVYGTNDFYSVSKGRYLIGNEIAVFLEGDKAWSELGTGASKEVVENAQVLANEGKPVVAIFKSKMSFGHIVIVLPGESTYSGKWQAKMPAVASFFYHKPEASFVNKPMSYAFSDAMRSSVVFYVKK